MVRHLHKGRLALVTLLVLSLALNALVIGAGIRLSLLRSELLGDVAYSLADSREIRRVQNAALRAHRDEILPALQALLAARLETVETASAAPFDRPATLAKMAAARARADDLLDIVQAALLEGFENNAKRTD